MTMDVTREIRDEVVEFLYHEAELLDEGRFEEWLALLADDVRYGMPVRLTRERGGGPDRSDQMQFFWEDRTTLELRVRRLRTEFAWAEDPPSRTRHFVCNVRVRAGPGPQEVEARSAVLLYRSRGDALEAELISGERRDVLRRTPQGWRLARREVVVDQAALAVRNLAVFV
jgi:3-phenylpropionate/cinnamic acid dioxygenase small subunit